MVLGGSGSEGFRGLRIYAKQTGCLYLVEVPLVTLRVRNVLEKQIPILSFLGRC